jgi:hypothetical protein
LDLSKLIIPIHRDIECEQKWSYDDYATQIEEILSYHCDNEYVSEYFKKQISQMIHQGYLIIYDKSFATPVRTIYEKMEAIVKGMKGRGKLKNISNILGFDVFHAHFGESSCIVENWINYEKKTNSCDLSFSQDALYKSLISSLSKKDKTGEWIVYSEDKGKMKFWCIWLHKAGDDKLIEIIKSQLGKFEK